MITSKAISIAEAIREETGGVSCKTHKLPCTLQSRNPANTSNTDQTALARIKLKYSNGAARV